MEYRNCYDVVTEIINETSDRFGSTRALNERKFQSLGRVCELVDNFVKKIDFENIDVNTYETGRLSITIVCDEVIFEHGRSDKFFELIQMLDSFSFSKAGRDLLNITLNIDDVW